MVKLMRYILLIIIGLIFLGCGEEDESSTQFDEVARYFSNDAIVYDSYEIADETILHTSINTDLVNVAWLFTYDGNEHMAEHKEFIDNYHIINTPLAIDEYAKVYKENYFNLETNKAFQKVYNYDYGLYEIKTNYCLINVDVIDCETYIYVRKI